MNDRQLHVTFGYSAAGSLKKALATLRRSEEVAPLVDDFTMGPLDPGDTDQRAEWEREELQYDEPVTDSGAVQSFWEKVSNWPGQLVVWMSSRSGPEVCGLHELVWRLPQANIHIVDVATVEFRSDSTYDEGRAFAVIRDERIVEHGLIDVATPLSDVARAAYRKRWEQLRHENAPLRVLTEKGLVSAPIDYFDEQLRERITDNWQSCARIVGGLVGALGNGRLREFHCDIFLFARLLHLLDSDDVEGESDEELWSMSKSRIRRRQ